MHALLHQNVFPWQRAHTVDPFTRRNAPGALREHDLRQIRAHAAERESALASDQAPSKDETAQETTGNVSSRCAAVDTRCAHSAKALALLHTSAR